MLDVCNFVSALNQGLDFGISLKQPQSAYHLLLLIVEEPLLQEGMHYARLMKI